MSTLRTLTAEHDRLHAQLRRDRSPQDWPALLSTLDLLDAHLDKEDLGLFPEALATLTAADWDVVAEAHQALEAATASAVPVAAGR